MKLLKNAFWMILFVCGVTYSTQAQDGFTYTVLDVKTPLAQTIDFSEHNPNYEPKLTLIQAAFPAPQTTLSLNKALLDKQRAKLILNNKSNPPSFNKKSAAPQPLLIRNFYGNTCDATPNDNDIAVSNSGKFIMSATNSNYTMYNDSGKFLQFKTLASIASQLGSLNRTFDPRVMYDPVHDRFVAVFLQGSTHTDTRAIVGFSVTEDPTKTWKFYQLPGNFTGDSTWSDYPIIAMTQNELFLTLNRVKDNTPWQTGFIESLIWQIDMNKGYAGDTLVQKVYKDILYNGKPVWSICPAKGGSGLKGPNMYFISMRPSDLQNDTVFLHEITNSLASGNASLTLKVLKSNVSYGLPPSGIQPNGEKLATNDARALSAMYEDDKIHFVGNCMYQTAFSPGIYYGVIDYVANTPTLSGRVIGYDTMDIGYPSIAYAGGVGENNSSMITFSYVNQNRFPGTAVVFVDRNLELSNPIVVKTGTTNIQLLADSTERWGDYTGIQRKYNEVGVCWLNGSYGYNNNNLTWIGKVKSTDPRLGINEDAQEMSNTIVYPNPIIDYGSVEFDMTETKWVEFDLINVEGKLVAHLLHDKAKAGKNKFSICTNDLSNGIYFIQIKHDNNILQSKKLVVAH